MKTATSFILGFALGMLCLAVALWSTGHLSLTQAQAAHPEPVNVSAPAPTPAPKHSATPLPEALVPSPPRTAAAPPPVVAPTLPNAMPKLAMPIAGVDPNTLHSNFEEGRAGHRHEA